MINNKDHGGKVLESIKRFSSALKNPVEIEVFSMNDKLKRQKQVRSAKKVEQTNITC